MYPTRRAYRPTVRSAQGITLSELVYPDTVQQELLSGTAKGHGKDACWLWQRLSPRLGVSLYPKGYVQILVPRLAYLFDHGSISDHRRVLHTCSGTDRTSSGPYNLCVRPSHLVLSEPSRHWWKVVKPRREQQIREEMRSMLPPILREVPIEDIVAARFALWADATKIAVSRRYRLPLSVVEAISRLPDVLFGQQEDEEIGATTDTVPLLLAEAR